MLVGRLEAASAAYVAGYVTKKMTSVSDPRLSGRTPEFARMSLRPGIGALAVPDVSLAVEQHKWEEIPQLLRISGKKLPIGRYIRRKVHEHLGREKVEARAWDDPQLRAVRAFAFEGSRSVTAVYEEVNQPYSDQIAARLKLRKESL